MEGLVAAMEPRHRSIGWVAAPTYDLADRVFREISIIAHEKLSKYIISFSQSERKLIMRNLGGGHSEVRAKSCDNPVSLLGEGLDWLIVDEFARLPPHIWNEHLSQRLMDKKGWALLISTPRGKGLHYQMWKRGQGDDEQWESWRAPTWQNPILSEADIQEERARIPESSFRQEYEAEFIEGAGAVFRNVRDCATSPFFPPSKKIKYYAGLDLAKTHDYTVLTIVDRDGVVCYMDRFNRIDWSMQITRVKEALSRYGNPTVYIDSTGLGEPVYEAFLQAGVRAEGYKFTAASKSALINNLVLLFEKKDIEIPQYRLAPDMIEELESFEYSVSPSGNVKAGSPSGAHDDCVISLALACWPLAPATPATIFSIPVA